MATNQHTHYLKKYIVASTIKQKSQIGNCAILHTLVCKIARRDR